MQLCFLSFLACGAKMYALLERLVSIMKDAQLEARRAESWQSIKALLIPLSLFIACLLFAAGTFLVVNGEALGWLFLAIAAAMIVSSLIGLIRFQNKYRARGMIVREQEAERQVAQVKK